MALRRSSGRFRLGPPSYLSWSEGQCDWWAVENGQIIYTVCERRFPCDAALRYTLFAGQYPLEADDNPDLHGLGVYPTLEAAMDAAQAHHP